MKILLLEPFFSGSHRQWAEGFQKESRHQIDILSLPGRHWKWRMFGGAVSLAEQAVKLEGIPDLIIATDMLDLSTFLALWQKTKKSLPKVLLYFHENQITYPWSPNDKQADRNEQYGFINFTSSLAADHIWFNSDFHRNSFLQTLPVFLKKYPDFQSLSSVPKIAAKSQTRYLGLNLRDLDEEAPAKASGPPVLLWNHRWEFDKDPGTFFRLCFDLWEKGINYKLIVLGEAYRKQPPIFKEARKKLHDRILHWGYAESKSDYAKWLWEADILPVTSRQDFFGGSTVEAIYCNNYPILPDRLAFPEHLDKEFHPENLYQNYEALVNKTIAAIRNIETIRKQDSYRARIAGYDWQQLITEYDNELDKLV